MDQTENYFLARNKLLEERIDYCLYNIESRLDKLYQRSVDRHLYYKRKSHFNNKNLNPFSVYTYAQFKAPYVRDFRNFSGPTNDDVKQIRELTGTENIELLIKNKTWSKESKHQLRDAVLDYYSQIHILELIRQKDILSKQLLETPDQSKSDIEQKLSLIEEQTEQVKVRKEQRIFVPEDRLDSSIDWCSISAKLASTQHDAQDCRLMWSNELHWMINDGQWTKEEDICLLNAIQKYGKNDWDAVARELNSNRLSWQCCSRYQQEFANASCGSAPITEDDIDKIIEVINLCRIGNFVPWNQVMYFIQYHGILQVKYQWNKLLSERRSNQPWSHNEDVLLLKTVEKFGDKDWSRVSNYIPGRSNKSCRERYTMRLRFLKRSVGNWRRKEDETLLKLIAHFGTNWSLISSNFPERNNHQLRNRYELLKNESGRIGPIKHKKLYRNSEGFLVTLNGRRNKPPSEREVDEKLLKIFTTYQTIKSGKSLVCRSEQDELIYQNLVQVIRKILCGTGETSRESLLSCILDRAVGKSVGLECDIFTPCISTIKGYQSWTLLQDYLNQIEGEKVDLTAYSSSSEYHQLLKVVMSLFLWPAILTRIRRPKEIKVDNFHTGSLIEKDSKNLYKIREIQKRIASHENC